MTTDGPFRTPDEVLTLNEKLTAKSEECEELRRERDQLSAQLHRELEHNERTAIEKSSNRTIAVVTLGAFVLLAWVALNVRQCEADRAKVPEGACREVVLSSTEREQACPYAGQITTPVGDRVKCTCPTTPLGSK